MYMYVYFHIIQQKSFRKKKYICKKRDEGRMDEYGDIEEKIQ